MKRLSVLFFLACLASGTWQFGRELTLSRISQVTDLTIDEKGEVWILSPSAIALIDAATGDPVLSRPMQAGQTFAVSSGTIYYVDRNGRLATQAADGRETGAVTNLTFPEPGQMAALSIDRTTVLAILEPARIAFATTGDIIGALNTNADRFAFLPHGDYTDRNTPFYTMNGNRIYAWTGGSIEQPGAYRSQLFYSGPNRLVDMCVDGGSRLHVLFTDSIMVIDENGKTKGRIGIGSVSRESRILANPADNGLIIFDPAAKNIQFLSETAAEPQELIVLNKNSPNPVDDFTEISFTIKEPLHLTLTIYNLIGEPVKQIARDRYLMGTHRVIWRADDAAGKPVPNGVYFYRLESDRGIAIKQLIVLR